MKFFVVALLFLILATALGSQIQVPHEPVVSKLWKEPLVNMHINGIHRPADCCHKYKQRIRCANMKNFFITSSTCSRPGVVFLNKKDQLVCADPHSQEVQNCMSFLRNLTVLMGEGGGLLEKK